MPESVRVLASFATPEEAHAARIQLEGAGVRARLAEESVVGIWFVNIGAAFILSLVVTQWGVYATLPVFMEGF